MPEGQEVECFDVEIFLETVPEGPERLEDILVETLPDLVVLGTNICLATEELQEQFCNEIDRFCSKHSVSDEMEKKQKSECDFNFS